MRCGGGYEGLRMSFAVRKGRRLIARDLEETKTGPGASLLALCFGTANPLGADTKDREGAGPTSYVRAALVSRMQHKGFCKGWVLGGSAL